MATVLERDLKKNIDSGNFLPVYLLYGNDDGLKRLYNGAIIKKTVGDDDCFNLQRFGADSELQEVYDATMQYPMLSDKKCVTLCDFDFEKAGENNFSRLLTIIEDLPDTTVLVLWFDNLEIDEKKSSRFKKLTAAVEAVGGMCARLDHRNAADLVKMLCKAAEKQGCRMESSTAKYLMELCSTDYNILKNELDKLTAYQGEGLITRETIDAVCVKSVEASVYNISRELAAKNIGKALNLLDELLFLKVKPHVILSVLSTAFVEMYLGKTSSAAGIKPAEVANTFGYKNREFVITRAIDSARRLDERTLGLCLSELLIADGKLKSTAAQERVIIEELMIKLVYIMSEGERIDKA